MKVSRDRTLHGALRLTLHFVLVLLALGTTACAATGSAGYGGLTGSRRPPVRGIVTLSDQGEPGIDLQGQQHSVTGGESVLAQLTRLPGAYIAIRGTVGSTSVRVRAFEILDAGDGLRPMVGNLVINQSGVMLEDEVTGTRLALQGGALAELKKLHEARVWVTGTVVGPSVVLVAHWGLLVPPP